LQAPGQLRQQERVGPWPTRGLEHLIVTGDLSLEGKAFGYPANGRMKKESRPDELLNQVCPIIAAAYVSQLMPQDMFRFLKPGIRGQKNRRSKKAQYHRRPMLARDLEPHLPADAKYLAERVKKRVQLSRRDCRITLQSADPE